MPMISYRAQKRLGRLAAHAILVGATILFVFPFYWLFISAFKSRSQIFEIPPRLLPDPWLLGNFIDIYNTTSILRAFWNSTIIAAGYCLLSVFLCSLGGYAFAKFPRAPGRGKLFVFVMGTMMIPGAATMVPGFVILTKLHMINTYWGMIVPGAATAFGIFWMRQYIGGNVPDELIDAARVDGCTEFGIYWRVVVPIIKPALAALAILQLIGSWNNLMGAFIILRTEDMQTMPLLIYLLQGEVRTDYGMVMAGCFLITLPLIVAFLALQKHFVRGVTAGAVKG